MSIRGELSTRGEVSIRGEVGRLFRLAAPLMVSQGGLQSMAVVDTFIVGRVSSLEMAGVALGNSIVMVVTMFGVGVAMGIEPLVAQAFGAKDDDAALQWMRHGLVVAFLICFPLLLATVGAALLLELVGVDAELAASARLYIWARLPGLVVNCLYAIYRSYLTCVQRVRPIVVATVIANVLNAALGALLVWELGFGAFGVGLVTSVAWTVMLVIAGASVPRPQGHRLSRLARGPLRTILHLGWPIGTQLSLEVGVFSLVAVLIARLGETAMAGHQIALMIAAATFMTTLGIAIAGTARVGFHVGAGDTRWARQTGFLTIALGTIFMVVTGLGLFVFAVPLSEAFSPTDPQAARVGADLLRIAAIWSLVDGAQVTAACALRGAGDTRWPFYANLAGHWLIGLPVGLFLGYELALGPAGFWWGLAAGLAFVALVLVLRFEALSRAPIKRLA